MHLRQSGFHATLALLALLAALAGADRSVAAPTSPCAGAKALADEKATSEARAAYAKLLRESPGLECAREGLAAITSPDPPDAAAAAEGLCARGKVYADEGHDADAKKAYDAALEKDVGAECARDGLEQPWWKRSSAAIGDALPDAALLLLGLGIAGLLLLLLGYIRPIKHAYARIWVVRWLLRPRLSLGDLDDTGLGDDGKIGAVMTARIRDRLQRFLEESRRVDVDGYLLDSGGSDQPLADLVAGDSQLRAAIGKLGEADERGKLAAAVLDLLTTALPIQRLSLTGVVEPTASKVPVATLMLTDGAGIVATTAVDTPALPADPQPADYLRLCDPAAVWTQYEVARRLSGKQVDREAGESYALVRAGLDLVARDRIAEAVDAFRRAIALQPRNWSAHVNLITVLMRYTDTPLMAEQIKDVMVQMELAGAAE